MSKTGKERRETVWALILTWSASLISVDILAIYYQPQCLMRNFQSNPIGGQNSHRTFCTTVPLVDKRGVEGVWDDKERGLFLSVRACSSWATHWQKKLKILNSSIKIFSVYYDKTTTELLFASVHKNNDLIEFRVVRKEELVVESLQSLAPPSLWIPKLLDLWMRRLLAFIGFEKRVWKC